VDKTSLKESIVKAKIVIGAIDQGYEPLGASCTWDRSGVYDKRFEFEYNRWDPKDCELFPVRLKPHESAVEGRSDADVQIARTNREKGRKTHRTV